MFSVFLELVKRVGIFVIIGQTILHFGISKKYEKYMKLVISFMVAAQVIFAFGVYLDREKTWGMIISSEEYMEEWNLNMEKTAELMESSRFKLVQELEEELHQREISEGENVQEESIQIEKIVIN